MATAVGSIGFPIGNVNSEKFEDEGFWHSIPLALNNGARHGTFK